MNIAISLLCVTIVVASNNTTDRDIFSGHNFDKDDKNATLLNDSESNVGVVNGNTEKNATVNDTCFDDLNVDEILNNEQLFRKYVRCLLDPSDKDCTPEEKVMKGALPEALATSCAKCSAKQREAIDKVVRYLLHRRHDVWERLEVRYDPSGAYWAKYEALYSRPDFHI